MSTNNNKKSQIKNKKLNNTRKTPQNIFAIILDLMYDKSYPRRKVVEYLMKKYGLSQNRCYSLIREAIADIQDLHKQDYEQDYLDLINKYENLYFEAMKTDDIKTAKSILTDLLKLKGLGVERKEVKHTGIEFNYILPTDDSKDKED